MLFSGVDAWRQGAFLYGGTLWAPFGAAADGPVVKVLTTRGIYTYRSGALGNADVLGQMTAISVMPGLHFTRGGISATVYAGLDRQWHVLIPDDVANPARGYHSGVRVAADLWIEPTTQTMITASATLTTIASAYALRLAGGWRAFDSVYIGPEGEIFGAENYRQWRFGMHVTGVKFFRLELQAAAGYSADRDGNAGAYVRFQATRKN